MKEKLIELLLSAEKVAEEQGFFNCHKSRPKAELIADYLIEYGVIVLPCFVAELAKRRKHGAGGGNEKEKIY